MIGLAAVEHLPDITPQHRRVVGVRGAVVAADRVQQQEPVVGSATPGCRPSVTQRPPHTTLKAGAHVNRGQFGMKVQ